MNKVRATASFGGCLVLETEFKQSSSEGDTVELLVPVLLPCGLLELGDWQIQEAHQHNISATWGGRNLTG